MRCANLLLVLLACGGEPEATPLTADGEDTPADTGPTTPELQLPADCEPVSLTSSCGSEASIVRGHVRLAPELVGAVDDGGELFVALTHYRLGGGDGGGYYHIADTMKKKKLLDGEVVPFELDMCRGGVMWSEENCEYNLVVILDQNGNQGSTNLLPDPGEPAVRVGGLELSCASTSTCLNDVVLDCTDGPSCVAFSDPGGCSCAEASCDSDFVTCL